MAETSAAWSSTNSTCTSLLSSAGDTLTSLKALVSSAFVSAGDLTDLLANGEIAGAGFEPATFGL
jgi:hypothetical protein